MNLIFAWCTVEGRSDVARCCYVCCYHCIVHSFKVWSLHYLLWVFSVYCKLCWCNTRVLSRKNHLLIWGFIWHSQTVRRNVGVWGKTKRVNAIFIFWFCVLNSRILWQSYCCIYLQQHWKVEENLAKWKISPYIKLVVEIYVTFKIVWWSWETQ